MEIGFVSAIFAEWSMEQVVMFAARHGFSSVEVMCWPKGRVERRYAGVTHIDVDDLDDSRATYIKELFANHGVSISALGYYPNPLDPDEEKREIYFSHLRKIIDAAVKLGLDKVNTFVGRHPGLNLEDNFKLFQQYWPGLVRYAGSKGISIGIENCPMLFTYDEWPGGKNMAISPAVWDRMFSMIPEKNFGLNYDPSHMIWQQMDYLEPIRQYKDRIFHVHLKDAKLFRNKLNRVGILATPLEYHSPRLPGRGDVDWKAFLSTLNEVGYDGPLVIEFEDKEYEQSEQDVIRGMLLARDNVRSAVSN
jgi:sugar phosphate isomerase/epimerase